MILVLAVPLRAQANSKGEEFFIISSVDQQKDQIVLMRPTQLTVAANFGPQTVCFGEKGQKLTPKDLRAGDTVWAVIKTSKNGVVTALRIREGAMTQAELRQLYLHYATGGTSDPPVKPVPLNPPLQSGAAQTPSSAPPSLSGNADMHALHPLDRTRKYPHGDPSGAKL